MRIYPLHYLSHPEFENLANHICNIILGSATIPFTEGPDGGRDGRFHGKADLFPSSSKPWEGRIVIQAKHTSKENASCSDSEFTRILNEIIIPSINRLKQGNLIDYYLLFTNRKLTGLRDQEIEDLILEKTDIDNIVIANEKIQQYLKIYPRIVRSLKLNDLLKPLEFDESDLKDVIISISTSTVANEDIFARTDFEKVGIEEKNRLNNLSKSYFDSVVRREFKHFSQIQTFLSSPINTKLKDKYEDSISELNAKITLRRDEYMEFQELIEDIYDYTISNDSGQLKNKKRLVRTMLLYMYCNCDIGKKNNYAYSN